MENILLVTKRINAEVPDLIKRADMLSTEEQIFIKNISKFFINKLDAISGIFNTNEKRSKVDLSKDHNAFIKDLKSLDQDIKKILETKKFSEVSKIEIPVMLGYRQNIYEATNILKSVLQIVDEKLYKILDETDTIVANVLADDDFRKSNRPFKYAIDLNEIKHTFDKALNNLIDVNGIKDVKPINELLPNLNSITTIQKDLLSIAKTASVKELESIETKIKVISERTNSLYEVLNNNPEIEVTKNVINELAYRLETTAKIVTNAISLIHIYNQTAISLKFIVERLSNK